MCMCHNFNKKIIIHIYILGAVPYSNWKKMSVENNFIQLHWWILINQKPSVNKQLMCSQSNAFTWCQTRQRKLVGWGSFMHCSNWNCSHRSHGSHTSHAYQSNRTHTGALMSEKDKPRQVAMAMEDSVASTFNIVLSGFGLSSLIFLIFKIFFFWLV